MMNPKKYLLPLVFGCLLFSCKEENKRPNIILILADDMGYSDIGCFGGEVRTPNIDALAKEGIRFTQMYTNAWCSPSRASLLTGLYPQQVGMGMLAEPKPGPEGPYQGYLNRNCVTVAEVLKEAGYYTALSGKWHLGDHENYWPVKRGFDHAFGLISGAANYFDISKTKAPNVTRKMALNEQRYEPPKQGFYMTDAISEDAVKVLAKQENKENPFFLYVAYTAPHWPLHALKADIEKYKDVYNSGWDSLRFKRFQKQKELGILPPNAVLSPRDEQVAPWDDLSDSAKKDMALKMEIYAAQIDRMDQGIGRILEKLNAIGEKENTIVIYLSDNGASAEGEQMGFDRRNNGLPPGGVDSYMSYGQSWANASNTPFRYYKKSLLEGGIATPMIIRWPEGIQQINNGNIENRMAHLTDIMPTLCEISGAAYPSEFKGSPILPMEGESLVPVLKDGKTDAHGPVFWSLEERKAVIMDEYKLESPGKNAPWELYHLSKDRIEMNDLSAEEPKRVERMKQEWMEWANRVGVFKGQPSNRTE